MHLCALNGKVEEMKYLIIKGAEVNLKVREKWKQHKIRIWIWTAPESINYSSHLIKLYPL
jgi:hypothetical protein